MTEKRVKIQSSFNGNEIKNPVIVDEFHNMGNIDPSIAKVMQKAKSGRPKLEKDRLRGERVELYCNNSEKTELYNYYGGSNKMRDFLLKNARSNGKANGGDHER